jgi:hypothetical protein
MPYKFNPMTGNLDYYESTDLSAYAPLASPTFTGQVLFPVGSAAAPGLALGDNTITGIYSYVANLAFSIYGATRFLFGDGRLYLIAANGGLAVGASLGAYDAFFQRDAANCFALINSTAAQTLRVYTTYTDTSNYERFAINTAAGTITLAAETLGSGSDNIDIAVLPAGTGLLKIGTVAGAAVGVVSTHKIKVKDGNNDVYYLLATNVA